MTPTPTLQELIEGVRADAPGEDALTQLGEASKAASELEQTTDALLGHFVDQCRRSGCSWSEISGALGVSKQAAHKRFSFDRFAFDASNFQRFTELARKVLAQSEEEAHRLGHGFVGTEHILLAVIDVLDGLGAQLLAESGVTKVAVEEHVVAFISSGPAGGQGRLPFTPRAKAALEQALAEALTLGHNYIGTEHVLLGLFGDQEGMAAQILAALGANHDDLKRRLVERSRPQ